MIGAFKVFVLHVLDHWVFLLGLFFLIEPAVDNSVPAYKQWAEAHLSRTVRAWITIPAAILCVFVACFLAFSDEFKAHERDDALINGTHAKPGYASRIQALEDAVRSQDQDINGAGGYKAQIAAMGGNLGKAQDQAVYWQQHKPQVVVQTKEVPVVIPGGAVQMTPEQEKRNQGIRVALSGLMDSGTQIQRNLEDAKNAGAEGAADTWCAQVEQYLVSHLDASYVSRFRDNSGAPQSMTTASIDQNRQNYWHGMNIRLFHMSQFITELSR